MDGQVQAGEHEMFGIEKQPCLAKQLGGINQAPDSNEAVLTRR